MDSTGSSPPLPPLPSRKQRFLAGYTWLILKNLIGWTLLLLALVAGPLVPGPGGIPLFLIGFALITFPGKRKLTARVLRGRPIRLQRRALLLTIAGISLAVPALGHWLFRTQLERPYQLLEQGPLATTVVAYLLSGVVLGLACCGAVLLVNLLLRTMPPIRRHVRPWLRRHRIRLLPPRRRPRHPHEHGTGPFRLKDEILSILKRPRHSTHGAK